MTSKSKFQPTLRGTHPWVLSLCKHRAHVIKHLFISSCEFIFGQFISLRPYISWAWEGCFFFSWIPQSDQQGWEAVSEGGHLNNNMHENSHLVVRDIWRKDCASPVSKGMVKAHSGPRNTTQVLLHIRENRILFPVAWIIKFHPEPDTIIQGSTFQAILREWCLSRSLLHTCVLANIKQQHKAMHSVPSESTKKLCFADEENGAQKSYITYHDPLPHQWQTFNHVCLLLKVTFSAILSCPFLYSCLKIVIFLS